LARAARFGADDYRRDTHLRRILGVEKLPRHGPALVQLLEKEAQCDAMRTDRSGDYRPARHVELLIAILGEAQMMRAAALRLV